LRLAFYPLPAARVFYAMRGSIARKSHTGAGLGSVDPNKCFEISFVEA